MYQAPTPVWNEIAASQPLSQPWATLFRMDDDQMPQGITKYLDSQAEAMGADNQTVLAYRLTAPLLMESEAISAYIVETQNEMLRSSLPELNSVNEAVELATMEYRLNQSQQEKLRQLLKAAARKTALP